MIIIVCAILTILLLVYIYNDILIYRSYRKKIFYDIASSIAEKKNKKLLVVGDPDNGTPWLPFTNKITGYAYGFGDICTDLTGCPNAPEGCIKLKGDLYETTKDLESNKYVVFISATLEYIPYQILNKTIENLIRISGGDIVNVQANNNNSWYLDHHGIISKHNTIHKSPPLYNCFEYSNKNGGHQIIKV